MGRKDCQSTGISVDTRKRIRRCSVSTGSRAWTAGFMLWITIARASSLNRPKNFSWCCAGSGFTVES
ncbi:hypothetical protein ATK06_1684 [Corynebacterium renale]|uniref:Uncharacterized protein n=1 Tax=Corynebacterium renale TaxID=1724 RepID=A0A2A9DRH0_9CORY|nr:hypothetical protein ATK06_1684 [Corynebacterium renale]STC96397.1 Uncharacterised protein [Corynebacterium renale]